MNSFGRLPSNLRCFVNPIICTGCTTIRGEFGVTMNRASRGVTKQLLPHPNDFKMSYTYQMLSISSIYTCWDFIWEFVWAWEPNKIQIFHTMQEFVGVNAVFKQKIAKLMSVHKMNGIFELLTFVPLEKTSTFATFQCKYEFLRPFFEFFYQKSPILANFHQKPDQLSRKLHHNLIYWPELYKWGVEINVFNDFETIDKICFFQTLHFFNFFTVLLIFQTPPLIVVHPEHVKQRIT